MKNFFVYLSLATLFSAGLLHCGAPEESTREETSDALEVRSSGLPLFARHGMTAFEYQLQHLKWTSEGYRPTDISVYDVGGQTMFAAIWEKKPGPAWFSRISMTSAEYQAEFDYRAGLGYRPAVVEGYQMNGVDYYAAIWEQANDNVAWVARHGMTSAQYQTEYDKWVGLGYRLFRVEGYGVGNTAYYAAIWRKSTGGDPVARHGMTWTQYQTEFNHWLGLGYRSKHVSAYNVGGVDYYAAIWELTTGHQWVEKHGLTFRVYQQESMDRAFQGYRLKRLDGYSLDGADHYAAIWVAESNALDGDYCENSQCFDLTRFADGLEARLKGKVVKYAFELRRGTSIVERWDGPARTAADVPIKTINNYERFNPASVSKSVTAVAILQLLTKKGISTNEFVYKYLPTNWNIPANNRTITFAELMNHTSGLWDGAMQQLDYATMQALMEYEISMGNKHYTYANVNYAVLRILIASLDGYSDWTHDPATHTAQRFVSYVNAQIFSPLGVYDVEYKPAAVAPVLFYPNPPGNAHGVAYNDWSLTGGPAGVNVSVHELALFGEATFNRTLLTDDALMSLKNQNLGFSSYGTMPDGSQCWGKNGFFPASSNNGAQIQTSLVHCENGVTGMVMANAIIDTDALYLDAERSAFLPETAVDSDPIVVIGEE